MRTPEEKAKIREEIEKRIAQTQQSIASLKEHVKPIAPDNAIGRITRMDAIQQKSVYEANLRTAEESLLKLEQALTSFEDPAFGLCAKCKNPIPFERILIIPETRLCVPCAEQATR